MLYDKKAPSLKDKLLEQHEGEQTSIPKKEVKVGKKVKSKKKNVKKTKKG